MKKLIYLAIASIVFLVACKKENEPVCNAGTGGKTNLAVFPQHHGAPIFGATAYIKFNTQSSSGVSNSDLTVEGEPGEEHIHVNGLRCGDYFIYCVGYDSTISMPVRGGIPFTIKSNQTGELDVHVPVTE